jgi:tight adherence protein B
MFLFIAFGAILLVTFATVTVATTSSRAQRVVERRYLGIRRSADDNGAGSGDTQGTVLLKLAPASSTEGLDNLLQRFQIIQSLEQKILQADVKGSPSKFIFISVGLAMLGVATVSLWFPIFAVQLVVALVFGYLPFGYLTFKRSRRMKKFDTALPDAIDMMARALRAGHAMTAAINIVAEQSQEPVRSEFGEVFKQQNFGLPIRDAMSQMLDRIPSPDLRVVVTGILVQKETGGNLAEILDRTANTIRERLKIQGEIRTHTAQGRMTGWILCALPVVMLIVINFINPGYSDVLVDTPMGHMLAYVGIGLLATGGLIIRAIINGIEV